MASNSAPPQAGPSTATIESVLGEDLEPEQVKSVLDYLKSKEIVKLAHIKGLPEAEFSSLLAGINPEGRRNRVRQLLAPYTALPQGPQAGPRTDLIYATECFPALGLRILGASKPSIPRDDHAAATIIVKSFDEEFSFQSPPILNLHHESTIWHHKRKDDLIWQHEPDIQNFVSYLIDDMIALYGLPVRLAKEASIKSVRPDFWILIYSGIPIGAIEVKIPREDGQDSITLNDKSVAGQGLDYLLELRRSVGLFGPVFIIISTYTAWRIFWLRGRNTPEMESSESELPNLFDDLDIDPLAVTGSSSTSMPTMFTTTTTTTTSTTSSDSPNSLNSELEDEVESSPSTTSPSLIESIWIQCRNSHFSKEEPAPTPIISSTPTKRYIFGDTRIYDIVKHAPELRTTLAKVLALMVDNIKFRVQVGIHDTLLVAATKNSWTWIDPLPSTFNIFPESFPNRNTLQLILVADLGAGLHGRVWIAASTGGALCILKFFKESNAEIKELEFWHKVYPKSKARIQQFMGRTALLMPPLPPLPSTVSRGSEVKAAVEKSVEAMLKRGVYHGDLRWENFGFKRDKAGLLIALPFDFGKSLVFPQQEYVVYQKKAAAEIANMFQ